jgi:hypothetical protein
MVHWRREGVKVRGGGGREDVTFIPLLTSSSEK